MNSCGGRNDQGGTHSEETLAKRFHVTHLVTHQARLLQRMFVLTQLLTARVTMDSEALVLTRARRQNYKKALMEHRCVQVCLTCVTFSFPAQQVAAT